jgi:hypothetical protein
MLINLSVYFQYKLYGQNENESESLNSYCMCHLEGEDRTMACFTVTLPTIGSYYLRSEAIQLMFFTSPI